MLNKLMNLRKKKGFTLIELIVVLVIMAILAAAAIPTVMGYIENSRKAAYLANVRAVYQAGQSAIAEGQAAGIAINIADGKTDFALDDKKDSSGNHNGNTFCDRVTQQTGFANVTVYKDQTAYNKAVTECATKDSYFVLVDTTKNTITKLAGTYQNQAGKYVEYAPGGDSNVMDAAVANS